MVHCQKGTALFIAKKVLPYSNISKKCLLCLHEKLKIINYPLPEELLNKRAELISKCRHANKFNCAIIKQSIDCNPLIVNNNLYYYFRIILFL